MNLKKSKTRVIWQQQMFSIFLIKSKIFCPSMFMIQGTNDDKSLSKKNKISLLQLSKVKAAKLSTITNQTCQAWQSNRKRTWRKGYESKRRSNRINRMIKIKILILLRMKRKFQRLILRKKSWKESWRSFEKRFQNRPHFQIWVLFKVNLKNMNLMLMRLKNIWQNLMLTSVNLRSSTQRLSNFKHQNKKIKVE